MTFQTNHNLLAIHFQITQKVRTSYAATFWRVEDKLNLSANLVVQTIFEQPAVEIVDIFELS